MASPSDATARDSEFAGEHRVKNVGRPLVAYQQTGACGDKPKPAAPLDVASSKPAVLSARPPRKRRLLAAC